MIKADLINKISQEMSIPKQEAEEGVNLFFETIREAESLVQPSLLQEVR